MRVGKYKKNGLTFFVIFYFYFLAVCTKCRKTMTKQAHTPQSSMPQSDFDELTEHLVELTLVSMTLMEQKPIVELHTF